MPATKVSNLVLARWSTVKLNAMRTRYPDAVMISFADIVGEGSDFVKITDVSQATR